jgi:sec-independent protein translocase protein TatA
MQQSHNEEMVMRPLYAFFEGALSPMHILLVLGIGILFFGRRLPEMGRWVGKSFVEFRKGLQGLEDELNPPDRPALPQPRPPQPIGPPTPTFQQGTDGAAASPPA